MAQKGFSSSGLIVGQTGRNRREQKSEQLKGNKVTMGTGVPRQKEGAVGDITVRRIPTAGLRCYIKTDSGWYDINAMIAGNKTNWIPMRLENSWATDATYGEPQYFKDEHGFVHLRGGVDSGATVTSDITTLPARYRPRLEQRRLVSRVVNASVYIQQIRITSAGVIRRVFESVINLDDTVDTNTTTEVCLDGISFFAHQTQRSVAGVQQGETSDIGQGLVA